MIVTQFRPHVSGTLQGFLTLQLTSGLLIKDISYYCREDGERWVSMPSRKYDSGGTTKYAPYINFVDEATRDKFQKAALGAVDAFLKAHPPARREEPAFRAPQPIRTPEPDFMASDQDVPF